MAIWKRFIRFTSTDKKVHYGEPTSDGDIGLMASKGEYLEAREIIGDVFGNCSFGKILPVLKLLSPLSREQTGPARALGANYPVGGAKKPPLPILFYKPPKSISNPQDVITIPKSVQNDQTDYEAELVIVIGKSAKNVSVEDALKYVGGYTLTNDLTAKKHQTAVSQWAMGKHFDDWLPIGPVVVSADLIDPDSVQLKTIINGKVVHDDTTAELLYKVAETVSHLSVGSTLDPGTIICTGSPSVKNPQIWLYHNDEIKIWGSHGLGTLVNYINFEGFPQAKL